MRRQTRSAFGALALAMMTLAGTTLGATAAGAQGDEGKQTQIKLSLDGQTATVGGTAYTLAGGLHVTFHARRDAAGGFHVRAHANPQGLSATGANGTTYRVNGAANFTANVGAPKGAASEATGVLNLGLIGQGQAPNYRLHVNVHFTVNANGDVTATVANIKITS